MKNNLIIKLCVGVAALILLVVFLHNYIGKYGMIALAAVFIAVYASCIHLSGYGSDKMLELAARTGIKANRVFFAVLCRRKHNVALLPPVDRRCAYTDHIVGSVVYYEFSGIFSCVDTA